MNEEMITTTTEEATISSTPDKKKSGRDQAKIKAILADLSTMTNRDTRLFPIGNSEIRDTVETFYDMQKVRIMTGNRAAEIMRDNPEGPIPVHLLYMENQLKETELTISKFLTNYAKSDPIGQWMLSIPGIGGVLSSGLLAYIDIDRCQTAGAIWKYAGVATPDQKKEKGSVIDYNPKLKTLCWKIGESFIKVSGKENDIYGHLYKEKKDWYIQKNEAGGFAELASEDLIRMSKSKKFNKDSDAAKRLSEGKILDGHITAMAARFAYKMFLSHLFEVWYEYKNGEKPPKPFVEEHLGHVHITKAPNRYILFPNEID